MDRDKLITTLIRGIGDDAYDRVDANYPVSAVCPTCGDRGKYILDFETYYCDCYVQKLLQKHYFAANIGREYHDICLGHFIGSDASTVVPEVENYLAKFDDNYHYGAGLTFTGPLGTGKTFAMTCVLKELIKQGRDVFFVHFDDVISWWADRYKKPEHDELFSLIMKVEVLGVDEVKSDKRNENGFLADGIDRLVRHRTSNLLPTIITTNMTAQQEQTEFTKAYSLLAAKNLRVSTKGHDLRMREIRNKNFEYKERGERRPIC